MHVFLNGIYSTQGWTALQGIELQETDEGKDKSL